MIRWMNLGNLSGLPRIPEFYLRCLFNFIIQISEAMAHAHSHDLIHGNFGLSKILVQRTILKNKQAQDGKEANVDNKPKLASTQSSDHEASNGTYKFFISNFEPYNVYKTIAKYQTNKRYHKLFKMGSMTLDAKEVIQMMKIKDLQAFANSIIEIMVGQTIE